MLVNKSITETGFEPLEGGDTVDEVRDRMEEQHMTVLPVVDQTTRKLIGQIEYNQLADTDKNDTIADLEMDEAVKIYEGQHLFEAVRLMLQYELDTLPLVDEESTFMGVLARGQVFQAVCRLLNLAEEGSVLTIELEPIDFSVSEIVQIVETEGAKILGMAVERPENTESTFQVTLKVNLKDTSRVTAALNRYDYSVLVESETTVFGKDLEHRADELIKYIDM